MIGSLAEDCKKCKSINFYAHVQYMHNLLQLQWVYVYH